MNNDLIQLTKALVSIPSLNSDFPQAHTILNDVVKKQLEKYHYTSLEALNFPSLLYSNQPDTKSFKILLEAHLDVNPAESEQFKPYEKDGKMYGRGVYDTKAAAAAMILAFKELSNELTYPLGLLFTTDGAFHGQTTVKEQINHGMKADFVITAEGSNFHIINKTKGHLLLYLKTSKPGYQAIRHMHEAIRALLAYYPHLEKESEKTTLVILKMDTTPENHCITQVDIRYATESKEEIMTKIQALIPKEIMIETGFHFVPVKTNPESIYIQHLQEAAQAVIKKKIPLQKTYGGVSEASTFFANAMDVIEFGPKGYGIGHINVEENVEWIDLQNLEEYYLILKAFLLSFNEDNK